MKSYVAVYEYRKQSTPHVSTLGNVFFKANSLKFNELFDFIREDRCLSEEDAIVLLNIIKEDEES